jgi:SAM-dependent methyltransferase
VVADATHLPFKTGSFSQVICSEVLEHLPEDRSALREMASSMKTGGSLILTFPHRHSYFAGDDRFVSHYRRYELVEMKTNLDEAGLKTVEIQKVLGKTGLRMAGRGDVITIRSLLLPVSESSLLCAGLVGCPSRTEMSLFGPSHSCGQTELIWQNITAYYYFMN